MTSNPQNKDVLLRKSEMYIILVPKVNSNGQVQKRTKVEELRMKYLMVLKSKLKQITKEFRQLCKLMNKRQEETRKFLVEGLFTTKSSRKDSTSPTKESRLE